jgi:CubicO group peptidase (beta-lactamase class C family)
MTQYDDVIAYLQIEEEMAAHSIPGLALAIVRDGETACARGFGVTSVEDGALPVTPTTLFRVGSVTKALTTTAAMHQVEAGMLDLDRLARDYVPWLTFSEPGAADLITLRMLLSHSAGLPTSYVPKDRRDPEGLEVHIRQDVQRYRLIAPPGRLYSYSNPGIRLIGYILQVVTGRPYAELMQELVFDPLDMRRTTFDPMVAMTYPLAQSHDRLEDGTLAVQHCFAENTGGYPSGMAISTAVDLTHFAIMQMSGGCYRGRRVLLPESVAEMQTIQADMYTATCGGYGLALTVDTYKGVRRVGHEGSISTFGTKLVMVPEAGVAFVFLFNRAPGFWTRAQAIADHAVDKLLGLPAGASPLQAVEPDRALWPRYGGTYLGDWRGLATVQATGDRLTLTWNGEAIPLFALRPDLYAGENAENEVVSVGLVPGNSAALDYLQVNSSPCRRFQPDPAPVLTPATWPAYSGRYSGVEKVAVRVDGDRLRLYSEEVDRWMPLVPLSNTRFASNVGLIEFQVAKDGSVPALRLGDVYTLEKSP